MPLKYSDYIKRFEDEKESRAYVQSMTSSGSRRNDSQVPTTNIMEEPPKKNLFSTTKYTGGKVATGATSVFEGIADTGAWGLIQAGKITSWMLNNKVGKAIFGKEAGNVDSNVLYDIGTRMRDDKVVETLDTQLDTSKTAQKSYVKPGSIGASVASGVGQVGGMILTGKMLGLQGTASKVTETSTKAQKILDNARVAINNPSTRVMFASTFGNGYSQAMTEGANELEATTFGVLNAAKESATEMMYGGLGSAFGKGALDDVAVDWVERTIKSRLLSTTTKLGIGMVAEGVEEMVATLLDPFIEQVYTHELDFSSYDSLADDFIVGALVSGILQTPGTLVDLKNKKPNEVVEKLQKENVNKKLDKINTDTNNIVENIDVDNSAKVDRINKNIDMIVEIQTTDAAVSTIDMEGLYARKQELIKMRDEITKKMTETQKIDTVKTLSNDVAIELNQDVENISPQKLEALNEKVEQVEALTDDIEKDKVVKPLSNKQDISINGSQYIQEASNIVQQMNKTLPEGSKPIEIVTDISTEQRQIMDLGAIFGKQVIFTNNMPQSGLVSQNNPNILFIDTKATSQLVSNKQGTNLYVLGHEMFHSMRQVDPKTYNAFVDYVQNDVTLEQIINFVQKYDPDRAQQILDGLKIDGKFDIDAIRNNKSEYDSQNQILNNIVEEMVANEFGGMISDAKYMTDLYTNNKTLFNKIVDSIRKMFEAITGPVYDSSLTQLQVEKIRSDFESIISDIGQKETQKKTKTNTEYKIPETIYRSTNTGLTSPKAHSVPGTKFYSTKQEISARYSKTGETKTANVKNTIKNPLIIEGNEAMYDNISFENKIMRTDDIVAIAKERGYDGVIFKNIIDSGPHYHNKIQDPISDIIVTIEQQTKAKTTPKKTNRKNTVEPDNLGVDSETIDNSKIVETVKPKKTVKSVEPKTTSDVKTTSMNMDAWFTRVNKMYDNYLKNNDADTLKSATNAYNNYKKAGGTEIIAALDTQAKADFRSQLKEAGLEFKELPKAGQKESQFYTNTALNSEFFESIRTDLAKNKNFKYYDTVSHKGDFDKAITKIRTEGDGAIREFLGKDTQSFDTVDTAMAKILMEYYKSTGDIKSEMSIGVKVREAITKGAQVTESAKIFKNMSPASQILQIEADLNKALAELEGSTNKVVKAWLSEHANGFKFTDAEVDWLDQNLKAMDKLDIDSREYNVKQALIQSFVANKIPKNIAQKAKAFRRIAMLFNPKTMGRNIMGNVVVIPAHRSADRFGSYLDAFLAKQSGVRTTGTRNVQAYKEGRRRGLRFAKEDFQLGINTDAANPFEKQIGKTWKDSDLKGAGKVLNHMEKWMNFGLDIGDRPFYEGYYENSLSNQMRLNNVTEATATMIEIAHAEAAKKTWKNNGKMVRLASTVRRIGNQIGFKNGKLAYDSQGNVDLGVGDIILPFIMTPANLAVAIYDYSPMAFASVYKDARAFNSAVKTGNNVDIAQKALVDSFGRASTGVVLFAIAYVLANAGLISGGEDEDKDVRALMKAQGYQPYSIKIGNTTFSYDWAQPIANPFAIMAELNRQTEMNKNNPNKSNEANNMFKAVSEAFTIGADRLYEQSFLQSLKNIFSAQTPQEAFINFTGDIPASFVPTLFKQIADTVDGNVKATYDKNNLLTSMFARAAVKIPVLKSTLPTKKDILGNDIELYGGENNIFNTMFNPAIVSKDKAGDVGKELSDVYNHTGEKAIMPQVVIKYIDYDTNGDGIKERITFNTAQQAQLQEHMGQISGETIYDLLNYSAYQNASYDDKANILSSLSNYAKGVALRDSGLVPNYELPQGDAATIDKYMGQGLSLPEALVYKGVINAIKPEEDATGVNIPGSQNGTKAYTIMNMQTSDYAKNIMLKLISPTASRPETTDSLRHLGTRQQYINYYSLSRTDYTLINKYSRDDYDISTQYFSIDGATYTKFAHEVSDIRADVDSNGNTIEGSKKNKVFEYINSLPLNQYQKLYLFSVSGYSIRQYQSHMFSYVNNLDISAEEKQRLWEELGF